MTKFITSLLASTALVAWAPPDDPKGPLGKHQTDSVELGSGQSGFAGSVSMDVDGDKINVSDTESTVDHIEVGAGAVNDDKTQEAEEGGDEQKADDEADAADDDKADDDTTEDAAEVTGEVPEEFKADDPDTVAQFDKALKNADGKLNMQALSAQWWANAQANEEGKGHLTESTYAYLDSLGIPREMVEHAEAGQQALNTQAVTAVYTRAGGKANFDAAMGWATSTDNPGYTTAQREAFNRALDKGGDRAADAVDLLMSRYEKASGSKRTSPGKSAGEHGKGGSANEQPGEDIFKDRDEWITARREAGRDAAKQQAVSDKFRRSPGAKDW